MPHSASAKKRLKQNLRNRDRNRGTKSQLKTHVRKLLSAIEAGDVDQAREAYRSVARSADKAASAKRIHRNKAARIKSRLSARLVAATSKGGSAAGTPAAGKGRKTAAKPKA